MKHIPTENDISAVKEKCADEEKLLIDFVDETAARIMEAVRLKWTDVTGDLTTLYSRKSKKF